MHESLRNFSLPADTGIQDGSAVVESFVNAFCFLCGHAFVACFSQTATLVIKMGRLLLGKFSYVYSVSSCDRKPRIGQAVVLKL